MDRVTDPMQLWVGTWGATTPSPPADRRQPRPGAAAPETSAPAPTENALDRPEAR
jgi:hypothetical protein